MKGGLLICITRHGKTEEEVWGNTINWTVYNTVELYYHYPYQCHYQYQYLHEYHSHHQYNHRYNHHYNNNSYHPYWPITLFWSWLQEHLKCCTNSNSHLITAVIQSFQQFRIQLMYSLISERSSTSNKEYSQGRIEWRKREDEEIKKFSIFLTIRLNYPMCFTFSLSLTLSLCL